MSAQGRDWAEAQRIRNLTLAAVLFKLGHVADPRGLVYRSQATLADLCGCDVKTIRRALQALEERGLIRREIRRQQEGSRITDHIRLNLAQEAKDTRRAACL